MLTLDTVSFDTTGLELRTESARERRWSGADGQRTVLELEDGPSPFLLLLRDADPLSRVRSVVGRAGRGVIEFRPLSFDGWVMLRLVTQAVSDPHTGWGRTYLGLLTIPFRQGSIVLMTEADERAPTGERANSIMGALFVRGAIAPKPAALAKASSEGIVLGPGDFDGWLLDPDDPTPAQLAASQADDAQYDRAFPTHALSRVRGLLDQVQRSVRVARGARPMRSFAADARPWWRVW